jgi:hypothetical protein
MTAPGPRQISVYGRYSFLTESHADTSILTWSLSVQPGNLVKHKEIPTLGYGLVMKNLGVHCMVQWTYEAADGRKDPGPTLEADSMLEVVSASR